MSKLTIPINLSQEINLTDGEKNEFSSRRNAFLSELRCITGLAEVVSSLKQDAVYKLVLAPEGAQLYKDAQGNLKGVFYKDGKIVEHAKLQEIGPSMLKAAKAVGTQVLLVSIVVQLNHIEKKVSQISKELQEDRLAEIEAGKSLLRQACGMQDPEKRNHLVLHAITELTRGFEKTASALARQIADLPEQKLSFLDNWLGDKSNDAQEKHEIAQKSLSACVSALQDMARCHLFLEERDAALNLLHDGLVKIEKAGVDVAYERSRLAPRINDAFPEDIWRQLSQYRKSFDSEYLPKLNNAKEDIIEIEVTPSELMGAVYAKV